MKLVEYAALFYYIASGLAGLVAVLAYSTPRRGFLIEA